MRVYTATYLRKTAGSMSHGILRCSAASQGTQSRPAAVAMSQGTQRRPAVAFRVQLPTPVPPNTSAVHSVVGLNQQQSRL